MKLALSIPGFQGSVSPPPGFNQQYLQGPLQGGGLYYLITQLSSLAIYISAVLLAVWLFWAAFEYIVAEGQKEKLHRARNRIIHALVGFAIIIVAFLANAYVRQIYEQRLPNGITPVSTPTNP